MKYIFLLIIKAYQYLISPFYVSSCRFYPSCSEYSYQAIKKYGALKGFWFSIKRLSKCHPYHPGGYDPVK